jgi:sugar phosphate permease
MVRRDTNGAGSSVAWEDESMASTTTPRRGSYYYGWNIVGAAVLGLIAANGVPLTCVSLYLKPWSKEFSVPISNILFAMTPMMLFMGISAAVVGTFADRKPARALMSLGLAALALITLAGSFATAAWQIEAVYALLFPVPVVLATTVVSNPLVSRWFVRRLGLALGITSFGIGVAGIVLPPLIAEVMPEVGWRAIWRVSAAVVGLVILPIIYLVVRDRPTEREGLHYVEGGGAASAAHGHGHGGGGGHLRTLDVLKRKNFWFVLAVFLPLGFIYIGAMNNLAPIAVDRGYDQRAAGMLLSVFNLAHVGSTLIMGLLLDRFGTRGPLALLAFVSAAAGVTLGLGGALPALVAGAALAGFSGGIWTILPAAAATEFGAANVGRVFGLFSLILPVHALMGGAIAKVKESTGSYTEILLAIAVACAAGGVIALFMRERRGGHPTPAEKEAAMTHVIDPAA